MLPSLAASAPTRRRSRPAGDAPARRSPARRRRPVAHPAAGAAGHGVVAGAVGAVVLTLLVVAIVAAGIALARPAGSPAADCLVDTAGCLLRWRHNLLPAAAM